MKGALYQEIGSLHHNAKAEWLTDSAAGHCLPLSYSVFRGGKVGDTRATGHCYTSRILLGVMLCDGIALSFYLIGLGT